MAQLIAAICRMKAAQILRRRPLRCGIDQAAGGGLTFRFDGYDERDLLADPVGGVGTFGTGSDDIKVDGMVSGARAKVGSAYGVFLRPGIAVPFILTALIWGSTWYVIRGQIDGVPAQWSIAYRFAIAAPAMFALALLMKKPLAMPGRAHGLALAMGLFQFCGNYTFVYASEAHLTSGVVALLVGMMFVPNALLARALLGQAVTARFLFGSMIALAGIGVLLVNEARVAPLGGNVALGTALALGGMLSASIANVVQAGPAGRDVPLVSLLADGIDAETDGARGVAGLEVEDKTLGPFLGLGLFIGPDDVREIAAEVVVARLQGRAAVFDKTTRLDQGWQAQGQDSGQQDGLHIRIVSHGLAHCCY